MEMYGIYSSMPLFHVIAAAIFLILTYFGASIYFFSVLIAVYLFGLGVEPTYWIIFAAYIVLLNIKPIRAFLISSLVMKLISYFKILPKISPTERVALEAGKVWIEGEYFTGKPNLKTLMSQPYPELNPEEKAFLNGPVEEVCKLCDDYEAWIEHDLPKEVWQKLRNDGFFGMIIPKEYGGLGFSALAHSAVVQKLSSRSLALSVTAMVPNSLGPAELLLNFGTKEQQKHYLPRLAKGLEIPCFALTEPTAGSDAGAIQADGVLHKKDGKLFVRLNWNKRWITLSGVSTVLGLAFKLKDPEKLLGKGEDLGITCALVPSNSPGVVLERRHDPMGAPFYNCPTQGKDVIISVDDIVGGLSGIGQGWMMLMECLGAGRGISLPAQNSGGSKLIFAATSAFATIRKQFGLSIGKFEGVAEPLARIGGYTYLIEAARRYMAGPLDQHIKPPVAAAIMKYQTTEIGRVMINDGMDILGGAGISRGSRNVLANLYISTPIGITVEGANILTRTLMIFGQGAMRAHPFVFKEVSALEKGDVRTFDSAFFSHIGLVLQNVVRAVVLSLTRGYVACPLKFNAIWRYKQKLKWASATFAFMSDLAMGTLGGKLKTAEMLTGRFADVLSWMFLATATMRRFEAEGERKEDIKFVYWVLQTAFHKMNCAFEGIFANFNVPILGWLLKIFIRPWSEMNSFSTEPDDWLNLKIAKAIQTPGKQRDRFMEGMYVPKDPQEAIGRYEIAFVAAYESAGIQRKLRKAIKAKTLPKKPLNKLLDEALSKQVITKEEFDKMSKVEAITLDAIQVDDFPLNRKNV